MKNSPLRIGTRKSALALWQAYQVRDLLEKKGYATEIIGIESPGDRDLSTPLHQFGSTGIFTKILDDALLEQRIHLAVHSLKDYPTQAPAGVQQVAVLERGAHQDVFLPRSGAEVNLDKEEALIATGSIRRVAQWLHRYPHHQTTNLRGNVQTRLTKLNASQWTGAVFAKAGLERMALLPENHQVLDWMIPAPAQGVIGITCREEDRETAQILSQINHAPTALMAQIERAFLRGVEGGCSAPVGALAQEKKGLIYLKAAVFELDGSEKVAFDGQAQAQKAADLGQEAAREVLEKGGRAIMEKLRNEQG